MPKRTERGDAQAAPLPVLSTAIVLVVAGAVAAYVLAVELPRRERNRSIELVRTRFSGHVEVVSSCPDWLQPWVKDTFAEDHFEWVVGVFAVHGKPPSPDEVAYLAAFPNLDWLELSFPNGVDSRPVLAHLPYSRDLTDLTISNGRGLPDPSRIPNVASLEIGDPDWGPADARGLERLPHVKRLTLWLEREELAEPVLQSVGRMHGLRELRLAGSKLTDDSLRHLAPLENLVLLDLSICGLEEKAAAHLRAIPSLQHLELDGNPIGDAAMEHVATLDDLRYLNLNGTFVGDEGVRRLARLRKLQWLYLGRTRVGNAGVAELPRLRHLRYLDLSQSWEPENVIDDEAVPALVRLSKLERLGLHNTDIGREGRAELLLGLPTTQIGHYVRPRPSRAKRLKDAGHSEGARGG